MGTRPLFKEDQGDAPPAARGAYKLKLDKAKIEDKKPLHLANLMPAQRLKRYKALLDQAKKKKDGGAITNDPTNAAGDK